jgi:hypothetical protein
MGGLGAFKIYGDKILNIIDHPSPVDICEGIPLMKYVSKGKSAYC